MGRLRVLRGLVHSRSMALRFVAVQRKEPIWRLEEIGPKRNSINPDQSYTALHSLDVEEPNPVADTTGNEADDVYVCSSIRRGLDLSNLRGFENLQDDPGHLDR